jgi:hypothetical protein
MFLRATARAGSAAAARAIETHGATPRIREERLVKTTNPMMRRGETRTGLVGL